MCNPPACEWTWTTYSGTAATVNFGSNETGGNYSVAAGAAPFTSGAYYDATQQLTGTQLAANVYTDANLATFAGNEPRATVQMLQAAQKQQYAKDDGQYGIALRTYLDDVGTGVDLGFYHARYHSKIPYIQMIGKGGVLAGDHVGSYITQYNNWIKHYVGIAAIGYDADGTSFTVASKDAAGTITAAEKLQLALANGAFGSGVCGGSGSNLTVQVLNGGGSVQSIIDNDENMYQST